MIKIPQETLYHFLEDLTFQNKKEKYSNTHTKRDKEKQIVLIIPKQF